MVRPRTGTPTATQALSHLYTWLVALAGAVYLLLRLLAWWQQLIARR
jgi:hypothetical protein